jgi:hypothetical protein
VLSPDRSFAASGYGAGRKRSNIAISETVWDLDQTPSHRIMDPGRQPRCPMTERSVHFAWYAWVLFRQLQMSLHGMPVSASEGSGSPEHVTSQGIPVRVSWQKNYSRHLLCRPGWSHRAWQNETRTFGSIVAALSSSYASRLHRLTIYAARTRAVDPGPTPSGSALGHHSAAVFSGSSTPCAKQASRQEASASSQMVSHLIWSKKLSMPLRMNCAATAAKSMPNTRESTVIPVTPTRF